MKLEFLDDISNGGQHKDAWPNQLIRLYDFDRIQARNLKYAINQTIIEDGGELHLHELEFIDVLNCHLTLSISHKDLGITRNNEQNFICNLTLNGFEDMIKYIEPFCGDDLRGYQWLCDTSSSIELLFSPGGGW